jgi:hypothetical protein
MQAPSTVNNCARADKGAVRRWYEAAEWLNYGWTVSRDSASVFSVSSATSTAVAWYSPSRRIRFRESSSGVVGYGDVISATVSGTTTNVTCRFESSASLTSSLSAVDVGIINPDLMAGAPVITPWVSYTPTFTGFGTATNVQIYSRRVGDTLEIRGRFQSGTSTATEARMTLGFNGANSNITSSTTKISSIQCAGMGVVSITNAAQYACLIESNVGYITFSNQASGAAGLTKKNGNTFLASGTAFSFTASIPVDSWPSN